MDQDPACCELLSLIDESVVSATIKERSRLVLSHLFNMNFTEKLSITHGEQGLCMEWPFIALLVEILDDVYELCICESESDNDNNYTVHTDEYNTHEELLIHLNKVLGPTLDLHMKSSSR